MIVLCASATAHADDLFGFADKPKPKALDCSALGPFGCVFPTDPMEAFAPAAVGARLDAAWLTNLPLADATQDRLASLAAGAARDPFGIVVPGSSGIENRWTIDGAPTDDPRTGGAGTRVPLAFLRSIAVVTGGFVARDRASTGAMIDAELARGGDHREVHAAAWLTLGTPARDVIDARYVPVTAELGDTRAATVAVTAGGPAVVDGAWYFAGVQARLQPFTVTTTARAYTAPHTIETIETRAHDANVIDVPFVARAGLDRGPHAFALTLVGTFARDTSFDPMATDSAGAIDLARTTGDAIATYRGRWADTRAFVQWSWHRDVYRERAHDPAAADARQLNTAFVPATLDDPLLSQACNAPAAFARCPMPTGYFAQGGVGLTTDTTADRPSVTAEIAHRIDEHRIDLGVTGEDARLVIARRYSGGVLERSIFGDDRIETRFITLDGSDDCGGTPCTILDSAQTTVRSRAAAAWLEDTWRPGANVAADLGARYEYQHLGGADALSALLPRASVAWDPLGGGRSRVFAGVARLVPMLPLRLDETIEGGPTRWDRIRLPGGTGEVIHDDPGTKLATGTAPMIADDITIGGEVALESALRLGAALEWRTLRRGLDSDGTLIGDVPAHRDAGTFTLQLATAPTAHVALRFAYTYARAFGDWSGPADPTLGATTYAGAEWTEGPAVGDLPSDLRHRFVTEVVTTRSLGKTDLIVGGRAIAASGRPIGAVDGRGAQILARGTLGRTPPATAADIHVALRRGRFEAGLDLLNVFDHRPVVAVDERYTTDAVAPISGGDLTDLVFLRGDDGAVPARNPDFGRPSAFLAPLTATLYARAAF
ncbi:MAG TPA: hypothetical protein VL463_24650 [Kofleriaceae bacterium]|nr:hypothetical protein [Kofleriaceae bacterium]